MQREQGRLSERDSQNALILSPVAPEARVASRAPRLFAALAAHLDVGDEVGDDLRPGLVQCLVPDARGEALQVEPARVRLDDALSVLRE